MSKFKLKNTGIPSEYAYDMAFELLFGRIIPLSSFPGLGQVQRQFVCKN